MSMTGDVLEAPPLAAGRGVRHGFFTRRGGVSDGVYASLNCGYGSGDDRAAVAENRRRVVAHLGGRHDDVVTVYQVHSPRVLTIEAPFRDGGVPEADALVTRTPGLVIGALAADCAPVLFADPDAGIVGAAHAGWRGALGGVLEATVDAMVAAGGRRSHIVAAVGPAIHQPAYEVGWDFKSQFTDVDAGYDRYFAVPSGKERPHFNLPGFCVDRLRAAGIGEAVSLDTCTYDNESILFSYRRKTHRDEPDYGRQISAIVLD